MSFMQKSKILREPPLFILLLLVSFASVSAVLFTPALPQIAHQLNISDTKAQLTITVFLIGYALGLLPYGPISNRFGRKPAAYLGISIAILGCLLVLLVDRFQEFWLLMLGRILMALGSSVGIKIAFTMVGDVYQHEKATKKISLLLLSFAIVPSLAMAIGGLLTSHFGWASSFYFQIAYSIFIMILTFFLPETCHDLDPDALKIKNIANNYLLKLKNKKLIICAFLMGCGTAVIYLFIAEAPFIGINHIRLKPDEYGLLNLIPIIGLIGGALLANFLAGKKEPIFIIFLGIAAACAVSAMMLFLFLFEIVTVWSLFIPITIIYCAESLVYANASSLIMSHAQNKSYASATMNFINIGMSVVTLFIFGTISSRSIFLMPLVFTTIFCFMFLLSGSLLRLIRRG
jgi:DHA1 family bicyclomycin/chloramphenicol resistance-like MFS transporter